MFDDVRRHIIYRLANAPLFHFPFLHIVVDEILPRDVYETLQEALPDEDVGATEAQPFRRALHPAAVAQSSMDDARKAFWASMFATMMHDDIGAWIMAKFYDQVAARFGLDQPGGGVALRSSTRLVRDRAGFALRPHTDPPERVISTLIYLPRSAAHPELGTSLYLPNDPEMTCPGGVEHDPALFDRAATIPFRPNTLLAFPKTPACFHGVEAAIGPGGRRDLLLFDLDVPT
jgi:hypothetical protein